MSDGSLLADSKSIAGSTAPEGEDAIGLPHTGLAPFLGCQ